MAHLVASYFLTLLFASSTTNAFLSPKVGVGARHHRLSATKEATFGMGCFWKPSEELLKVVGVVDTTVGYTGNPSATDVPTYDNVCFGRQWVEGVRVEYDDAKISYEELLDSFFELQEPKMGSRQYASIIFPHDDEQSQIAMKWLKENGEVKNRFRQDGIPASMTTIEPLSKFYQAEGYHQRYWQKQRPRLAAMVALLFVMSLTNSHNDSLIASSSVRSLIYTGAEGMFFVGAAYVLFERFLDRKVVEI